MSTARRIESKDRRHTSADFERQLVEDVRSGVGDRGLLRLGGLRRRQVGRRGRLTVVGEGQIAQAAQTVDHPVRGHHAQNRG